MCCKSLLFLHLFWWQCYHFDFRKRMRFTCIFENDGEKSCKNWLENEFCILPPNGSNNVVARVISALPYDVSAQVFRLRPNICKLTSSCQTHFLPNSFPAKMHPLRTGAEKLPGLSRDLPIVNLHKTRKTQSYQLVHIHKICKQDFALTSPSHNLINTKVVYDLFSISIHTCLSLFQVAIGAHYIHRLRIFTQPELSRKKEGKSLSEKIFHLAGSESRAMCGLCQKGRGLLIIVRIGQIWGSFGETRQVVDICRRTKMQALVLTLGGPGQILLQMDLFSWDTDAYLVKITPKGRNTCPWRVTQGEEIKAHVFEAWIRLVGIFKMFRDICKHKLCKTCGFSIDPDAQCM